MAPAYSRNASVATAASARAGNEMAAADLVDVALVEQVEAR